MSLTRMSTDNRWHVRQGEPELLGYSVVDAYGDFLGEVVDLIIDTRFQKVPFVVVMAANGLNAHQRVILPMREVTLQADERQLVCQGGINALDIHVVDNGGDLPNLVDPKLAATFLPDLDKVLTLDEGQGGTEVATDARLRQEMHPSEYCEKVDEVHLRDAQGQWVEKKDAEGRDTCQ
jgi:hypothetical protein